MSFTASRYVRLCAFLLVLTVTLVKAKPVHKGAHVFTGSAVYYNDKMQGRALAMKVEKYDSAALTAATHSTFPLGSTVKVTNFSNNKTVSVRVNDRMNPKSKSVIDLSRKAAEEIDLIHSGHARVRVELDSSK